MRQTNSRTSAGEIVGFDVDLMNAVAKTLGLTPDYRETAFEAILPSVSGGRLQRRSVVVDRYEGSRGRTSTS